jgi:hypothetical protein
MQNIKDDNIINLINIMKIINIDRIDFCTYKFIENINNIYYKDYILIKYDNLNYCIMLELQFID